MANVTLSSVADVFPVSTSVSAYSASNWPGSLVGNPSGAPVGSSSASATVASSGSLAFTGLAADTRFFAYASVSGEHRYRAFSTLEESRPAEMTLAQFDARYDPQYPPAVCSPSGVIEIQSGQAFGLVNRGFGCRVIVPRTGALAALAVYINGTGSGNVRGAVYDVGAQTSAVRTRIWDGASTPSGATTDDWLSLGAPGLSVVAGTHLDLWVQGDNTTVQFGKRALTTNSLPSGYGTVGGCLYKLSFLNSAASFASPASLSESAAAGTSVLPVLIARIT